MQHLWYYIFVGYITYTPYDSLFNFYGLVEIPKKQNNYLK